MILVAVLSFLKAIISWVSITFSAQSISQISIKCTCFHGMESLGKDGRSKLIRKRVGTAVVTLTAVASTILNIANINFTHC